MDKSLLVSKIRIGTRKSALALAQTRQIEKSLRQHYPDIEIIINPYETSGDKLKDTSLSNLGGKGLFTKEIEEALLSNEIDVAVHSMKDFPVNYPDTLIIASVPLRESPFDVLLLSEQLLIKSQGVTSSSFYEILPMGAKVGTTSLRRSAQLKIFRPDVQVVPLRGNITTRIEKLKTGLYDAIILAEAGLNRLDIVEVLDRSPIPTDFMLPAIGQGALALECRQDDVKIHNILKSLDEENSHSAILAERAFLKELGGGCNFPVAAYACIEDGQLVLEGMIMNPSGSRFVRGTVRTPISFPEKSGELLAYKLLDNKGQSIMDEIHDTLGQKGQTG